jgi:ribonuclease R
MKDKKARIEAFINQKSYHPLLFDELAVVLDVPSEDRELFRCALEELEAEGRIIKTRKNRYAALKKMGVVAGSFQGHERGFGFVVPDADLHLLPQPAREAIGLQMNLPLLFRC